MKKTLIAFLFLVIVILGGGVAWYFYYTGKANPEVTAAGTSSYRFTAVDLFNEYATDENRANNRYLNKVIEVTGEVYETDRDQKGERMLVLKENDDMFGVVCSIDGTDEENKKKGEMVKQKDHVVLKGICAGFDGEVRLERCVILSIGPVQQGMKERAGNDHDDGL